MRTNNSIRLFVGLGNPGAEYVNTRHNVGAQFLDTFVLNKKLSWTEDKKLKANIAVIEINGKKVLFAKPIVYMNDSGTAVQKICSFYKINTHDVVVACDDITIDVGFVKFTSVPGNAGHNGIKDIESKLGVGFCRYRIGVGGKHNSEIDLKDHVLGKLDASEKEIFNKNMQNMLEDINLILDKGVESAMNLINIKKTKMENSKYTASFILDMRNCSDTIEDVTKKLETVISGLGGKISESKNLGQKTFENAIDKKFPNGIYIQISFDGPKDIPAGINEKLKLDKTVNRILIEKQK